MARFSTLQHRPPSHPSPSPFSFFFSWEMSPSKASPLSSFLALKKESILSALSSQDLDRLRELASLEGGFVDDPTRAKVWPFLLGLTTKTDEEEDREGKEEVEVKVNILERSSPALPVELDLPPRMTREGSLTPPPREPSLSSSSSTHPLSESWIQPDSSSSSASSTSSLRHQHEQEESSRSSMDGMEGSWVAGLEDDREQEEGEDRRGRGGNRDGTLASSSSASSSSLSTSILDSSFISTTNNVNHTTNTLSSTSTHSRSRSRSRSSSPSHFQPQLTTDEPSSSLLFPSPSQSFAHLPPLPSSPPPAYYSSSTTTAAAAPVEWGFFEGGKAEELDLHRDEGQIRLDTRRGFVVWPEVTHKNRLKLQASLHALIVTVMRRHPPFRYFQGFHDIASVLLLTFLPLSTLLPINPSAGATTTHTPSHSALHTPQHSRSRSPSRHSQQLNGLSFGSTGVGANGQANGVGLVAEEESEKATQRREARERERAELCARCLERLSLFRIRDGMGEGLEPVMGLLRLMKRLLRVADPELSKLVNQATPLPFFALSWLLTLFSHDVDSFPIIQLLFDFLLSHNPVVVVYLSVAIIISKKPLILTLSPYLTSDPGLLHTTLSSLPPFLVSSTPASTPTDLPSPPTSTITSAPHTDYSSSSPPPPLPSSTSTPSSPETPINHPPLPLPTLFALTTQLYTSHPPFKPVAEGGVGVGEVMGARSVVFTYEEEWEERRTRLEQQPARSTTRTTTPTEHDEHEREIGREEERVLEAERIVASLGEMVNLSFVEDEDSQDEEEDRLDDASKEKEKRSGRIVRRPSRSTTSLPFGVNIPSWAVGVAVLVVVGAVGVGVWRAQAHGSRRGPVGFGLGGERFGLGWVGGGLWGVWEGLVGSERGRGRG